jgi:hypothetical protein
LLVNPDNVGIGPAAAGSTLTSTVSLTAYQGFVIVTSVTLTGPGWSQSGFSGGNILKNQTVQINLSITEGVDGTYPGTLTINTEVGNYVIQLSALFATGLTVIRNNAFPTDVPRSAVIISASEVGNVATIVLQDPIYLGHGSSGYGGGGQLMQISIPDAPAGYSILAVVGGSLGTGGYLSLSYNVPTTGLAPWSAIPALVTSTNQPGLLTLYDSDLLTLYNPNSSGSITITAITTSDPNWVVLTTNLPVTIPPLGRASFIIGYNHEENGPTSATITVTNNSSVPSLNIPVTASAVPLVSNNPLVGTGLVLAFGTNSGTSYKADTLPSSRTDQSATLIFNEPFWDMPGMEKTLMRLEVFYEDLGICALELTATTTRPQFAPFGPEGGIGSGGFGGNAPIIDTKTSSINIGSIAADGKDQTAFFDIEATGELIILMLKLPNNQPPGQGICSLTGFTPHFADRGEKVENV